MILFIQWKYYYLYGFKNKILLYYQLPFSFPRQSPEILKKQKMEIRHIPHPHFTFITSHKLNSTMGCTLQLYTGTVQCQQNDAELLTIDYTRY